MLLIGSVRLSVRGLHEARLQHRKPVAQEGLVGRVAVTGMSCHFFGRRRVGDVRPDAGLGRRAFGGDGQRIVFDDGRRRDDIETILTGFEWDVVVVEEIDRPDKAVIDGPGHADTGSFEPVFKREKILFRCDADGEMIEAEWFCARRAMELFSIGLAPS